MDTVTPLNGPPKAVSTAIQGRSEVLLTVIKIGVTAFAAALLWIIGLRNGFLMQGLLSMLVSQLRQLSPAIEKWFSK
jgi:hypothetical protein